MTKNEAFILAEKKIEEALRTRTSVLDLRIKRSAKDSEKLTELPKSLSQLKQLKRLELAGNQLETLPDSLSQLTQLQWLDLSFNRISMLPEFLGQLTQLQQLYLYHNQLTELPDTLSQLTQLQWLGLSENRLTKLPDSLGQLKQLQQLYLSGNLLTILPKSLTLLTRLHTLILSNNRLTAMPDALDQLNQLRKLDIASNQLTTLPASLGKITTLRELYLDANPLNAEFSAAYEQGTNSLKIYLLAQAKDQIVLNEAKLIAIGEGEVGKTSLLGALRGDDWVEKHPTTHGVEIDIKTISLEIPTGQKAEEKNEDQSGNKQFFKAKNKVLGFVQRSLKGFKTDANNNSSSHLKITFNSWDFGGQNIYRHTHQLFFTAPAIYLVVWNPRRGPDQCRVDDWIKMVRQRAFDKTQPKERPRILVVATHGGPKERSAHIDEQALCDEFGNLIVGFHHVDSKTGDGLGELKAAIVREAAAIPSVGRCVPENWKKLLDALQKRSEQEPYIQYKQYQNICHDLNIENELVEVYAAILNELGYLIHYQGDDVLHNTLVLKPEYISKAVSYVLEDDVAKKQNGLVEHDRLYEIWNDAALPERDRYPPELHPVFLKLMNRFDLSYQVVMPKKDTPETSLIAQLVPSRRPDDWQLRWPTTPSRTDDVERRRICRIVDKETGRPTEVYGLLYRLIVRLHRYSLGKSNYFDSRHWKTGMILDDGLNGCAFIEDVGGDVHVTVRAAYPDGFLGVITGEIRALIEQFWKGLDCRLSVPCRSPCKGLHELEELIETKYERIDKVRCNVCKKFYEIDSLLVAATPKRPVDEVLAELNRVRHELANVKGDIANLSANIRSMVGQANEQFELFMNALTNPAKDGPRLFSFEPIEPDFWDKPTWVTEKFRLTLWCEHARMPLPALTGEKNLGVYEIKLPREWIQKSAPYLKFLSNTLSLALPIFFSRIKLDIDDTTYKSIEDQLKFGKNCAESFLKGGKQIGDWISTGDATQLNPGHELQAYGAELRELHTLLKQKDPTHRFGGLVRVQNKRREFLWVHKQFASEY